MPNSYGNYNETFFAQEALIQLEKALGFAGRIHRGFGTEPAGRGDTIKMRRPSTFVAQNAPSVVQSLATGTVDLVVDQYKDVHFEISDKDATLSRSQIISDHIRPAAYALADAIDSAGAALYKKIPWYTTLTATPVLSDLTAARKVMFDNKVPLKDTSVLHGMVNGALEAALLNKLTATTGSGTQDPALVSANIGNLYGFNWFANQNVPAHTSGVGADSTGTVDGVNAVGATTLEFSDVTAGITWKIGDSFSIAGDEQRYVATADGTDADGAAASIDFTPPLKKATAGTEVITLHLGGAAKGQNLMFHKNAFMLATAPLSMMGNGKGAQMATVSDPSSGISLRSSMWWDGATRTNHVALEVLYGYTVLDPNLAVRLYEA